MSLQAGAVVWAVVPFAPEAPFRLYAGAEREPVEVPDAGKFIAAARRGGDQQFTYLVPGKARPVLLVSSAYAQEFGELLALRLSRFSKLSDAEREAIRDQTHPALFHLRPDRFDLPEENAAMVSAPVRVHRSAIDPSSCGELDPYELATVHERFIRFHGFNVRKLVEERIAQLAEIQRQRGAA